MFVNAGFGLRFFDLAPPAIILFKSVLAIEGIAQMICAPKRPPSLDTRE
jgi:hypothetical protein